MSNNQDSSIYSLLKEKLNYINPFRFCQSRLVKPETEITSEQFDQTFDEILPTLNPTLIQRYYDQKYPYVKSKKSIADEEALKKLEIFIKKNKNTHKLNERNRKFSFGKKLPKQNTESSNLVEHLSKLKDNLKSGDDIKRDDSLDQNDNLNNEKENLKSDVNKDGDKSVNL